MMNMKMRLSPGDLCTLKGLFFTDVLEYAYSLEVDEEPNYRKVDFLLKKILLDQNVEPITKFYWWNQCSNIFQPTYYEMSVP